MSFHRQTISVFSQKRLELIDITKKIEDAVIESEIEGGLCHVFVAHATAGIICNENESGLINDFLKLFQRLEKLDNFEHNQIDDNAPAHLLSGLIGPEITCPIENGQLVLGRWQRIFLAEFDGPRSGRQITVTITGG
ncbi:MAG: secondary thiamine-phosphate synthase enzyme YjbQ [Patescibacteria group bacterium]|nr:secondary thiamine-phosphate synthase enzyme YjbQ [Patescibacteria group bacterium]